MKELLNVWGLFHLHCRYRDLVGVTDHCSHDSNYDYEFERESSCCFEDCPLLDLTDYKDGNNE